MTLQIVEFFLCVFMIYFNRGDEMIYFIRHGLDDESYIGGWSNISLTDTGRKQIKDSANWIKDNLNIKRIISSDVSRAKESALIIASILNIDVACLESLREQNKGIYNGLERKKLKQVDKTFIKNVQVDTIFPEGESLKDLYRRISKLICELNVLEDDTLIVTHRGVINMIYYNSLDIPLDMDKERFLVTHGSVHEYDKNKKMIRRIY